MTTRNQHIDIARRALDAAQMSLEDAEKSLREAGLNVTTSLVSEARDKLRQTRSHLFSR